MNARPLFFVRTFKQVVYKIWPVKFNILKSFTRLIWIAIFGEKMNLLDRKFKKYAHFAVICENGDFINIVSEWGLNQEKTILC